MGQNLTNQLEEFKDDVVKEAHMFKEVLNISHEEFLVKIEKVNQILIQASDNVNARLEFKVREGSDTSLFWRQTVKIICVRQYESPEKEVICKVLSLKQFLLGYKMILYHMTYKQDTDNSEGAKSEDTRDIAKQLSASMILDKFTCETNSDVEDCIICMERKPEVTLPCTHAYCLFCIEQWNVSNKTCPVCRETVENTDESWVTPDIPDSSEINAEVNKALTELTLNLSEEED